MSALRVIVYGVLFLAGASDVSAESSIAEPSTVSVNPATLVRMNRSFSSFGLGLGVRSTTKMRYVGFPTVSKTVGLSPDVTNIQTTTNIVLNKKWSLGILSVKPPINLKLQLSEVPLVIFNQVNRVNLDAKVSVLPGAHMFVGYEASRYFAVGAAVNFGGIKLDADATTLAGDQLADISMMTSATTLQIGVHAQTESRKVRLGLLADLLTQTTSKTSVELAIAPSGAGPEGGQGGGSGSTSEILKKIRAGASLSAIEKFSVGVDFEVTRNDQDKEEFSLVEFRKKPKDLYSKTDVLITTETKPSPFETLRIFGKYEPSDVGPGGRGEGSKAGFSVVDGAQVYAGVKTLLPAWSVGIVWAQENAVLEPFAQKSKSKTTSARSKAKTEQSSSEEDSSFNERLNWSVGVTYRRASLGIDELGEQPGAYSQTKLTIPFSIGLVF